MNNTNNMSQQCGIPVFIWYEYPFNVSMFVLYILVIVAAIIGNILVCMAVFINPKLRQNVASYFIVSLAISDISTAALSMPFDVEMFVTFGRWYHSELMCIIWTTIYLITVPISMWNLLVLSIDRYKTLKNPWDRFKESPFMTKRRAMLAITCVWTCCIAVVIGPLMGWKYNEAGSLLHTCTGTMCTFNLSPLYLMISSVVNFYIPMIAMCVIYHQIYKIARTQYITRPTSAVLEIKSGESPATLPKAKNKPTNTDHMERGIPQGRNGPSTINNVMEKGLMNMGLDDVNGQRFIRCGTMIEVLNSPEENDENIIGNCKDQSHETVVDDKSHHEIVDIELPQGNITIDSTTKQINNENNDNELQGNDMNFSANYGANKEKSGEGVNAKSGQGENGGSNDENLIDNKMPKNEENEILPKGSDKTIRLEDIHSNQLCANEKEKDIDLVYSENNKENISDVDCNEDCDDYNNENVHENVKANDTVVEDDDKCEINTDDNHEYPPAEKPSSVVESMTAGISTSTNEGPRPDLLQEGRNGPSQNDLSDIEIAITHGNSSQAKEDINDNGNDAGVSQEMHVYLRRKVSGDAYNMKYASRESIESACTVHTSVPETGNSTLNLAASMETLNSFGSMENLTKRKKIFVKNKKAAQTISMIVITFLTCWLPLTTFSIVQNICQQDCFKTFDAMEKVLQTQRVFLLLGYISSAINPIVYSYRNVQFRIAYRKMFKKLCPGIH